MAPAVAFLTAQQATSSVILSIVSALELIAGCRNGRELAQRQVFLRRLAVRPVSVKVSQRARQLMEAFVLSHGLSIPDALIAATALEHGLTLYTRNIRHYQMIPGLSVVLPY